jgi:hypothetical protein
MNTKRSTSYRFDASARLTRRGCRLHTMLNWSAQNMRLGCGGKHVGLVVEPPKTQAAWPISNTSAALASARNLHTSRPFSDRG